MEIVVVLALIGLTGSLLIIGTRGLLQTISKDDVENTAFRAIGRARYDAVLSRSTISLHVEEKDPALVWETGSEPLVGEDRVRLLPATKTSASLIGGRVEEGALARVRFYANGTCDPFRLEIIRDHQTSRILSMDPWTCQVLAEGAPAPVR